ncbi:ribonuclease H-like domain-containing protein [Tanacetum coccineum]
MHRGTSNRVNGNNSLWSTSNVRPTSSSTTTHNMTQEQVMALIYTQQALMAQFMYHGNQGVGQSCIGTQEVHSRNGNNVTPGLPGQPTSVGSSGQPAGHETLLPNAFSALTLQDHTPDAWNMDTGDTLSRYKARLVANDNIPLSGIDVDKTFSPVVKPATIWIVLSLATSRHWSVHQLDVKNSFLHGMFLSQCKYATEILKRAHMVGCNPTRTPVDTKSKLGADGHPVSDPKFYQSLAGALQYLTFTRPYTSYAVQQVCLYMHDPREPHFLALKWILRLEGEALFRDIKDVQGEVEKVRQWRKGEDCGFDSNEEEVVPKVDDVSLVDGVFDGAFGGDGDEDFIMGEGVVVSSSSLVKSTKSFLGRMMVSLIFLEGLEEKAWVEAMGVKEE